MTRVDFIWCAFRIVLTSSCRSALPIQNVYVDDEYQVLCYSFRAKHSVYFGWSSLMLALQPIARVATNDACFGTRNFCRHTTRCEEKETTRRRKCTRRQWKGKHFAFGSAVCGFRTGTNGPKPCKQHAYFPLHTE